MLSIGIDLGTSGVKLIILDENGNVLFKTGEPFSVSNPHPGWSEQDPDDWYRGVKKVLHRASEYLRNDVERVKAIGLSGQMHGAVLIDREGNVIRPAILWNDTRSYEERNWIMERVGIEDMLRMVQNLPLEGFTLPKLLWVKRNESKNYEKIWKVLLPKDYINFKLTGRIETEVSDASGTAYFDVLKQKWSDELLSILSLSSDILPEVLQSTDVVATILPSVAEELNLPQDCIVVAGGADNACAALGSGVTEEGMTMCSIGSSGTLLSPTPGFKRDEKGRLHFFSHAKRGMNYNMGVVLSAGMSLNWFVHNALRSFDYKGDVYELLNELASNVPVGSEGLLFYPYLNGERTPHMNAKIRGGFIGLSLRHTLGNMARSIMEGVTFALRDSLEIMKEINIAPSEVILVGGGEKSKLWSHIVADVFSLPVKTLKNNEGAALGAAILAGVGGGIWQNLEEGIDRSVKVDRIIEPDRSNAERYNEYYDLFVRTFLSLRPSLEELFDIRMQT